MSGRTGDDAKRALTRRGLCLGLAAALVGASGRARAQASPLARVVAELERDGYEVASVRRTLLGRIRIEATRPGQRREIVFDRTTGEILRDLTERRADRGPGPARSGTDSGETRSGGDAGAGAGGRGSGRDDRGRDDRGRDDRGRDDSGRGRGSGRGGDDDDGDNDDDDDDDDDDD